MRFSRGSKAGLLFYTAVLACAPLRGQTLTGTILGTITDQSQAVIPGVQVNITDVNTNYHRTETSNDSGFFAFGNLDPGNYRIDVQHTGFRKLIRSDIAVGTNTTIRADLELTPGAVTEV